MDALKFSNTEDAKTHRLDWLRRVYCHEPLAVSEEEATIHLFDRLNDFGMQNFVDNFRPLNKLREKHGPIEFSLGKVNHAEPDLCYAELCFKAEVVFILRVRFEVELPCRVLYWGSYPPLPEGVTIRPYTPDDATGCVALELACPFESDDGAKWTLDRGARFDEYLQLMAPIDAWVADFKGQIVGFFSCALRPIRFNNEDCYGVYQHHYRVHPEHRAGSVSMALSNHVDARRTFAEYQVPFPYSLVDPGNKHMKHMGFPPVDNLCIARMSLSIERLAALEGTAHALAVPSVATIIELMDAVLYPRHSPKYLEQRWARTASFGHENYHGSNSAFVAFWDAQELNIIDHGEGGKPSEERRLSFVLDYGFREPRDLLAVLTALAQSLETSAQPSAASHLCFLCDTRAPEYTLLHPFAEDEAQLALHTLPWVVEPFQHNTVYCDAVYC